MDQDSNVPKEFLDESSDNSENEMDISFEYVDDNGNDNVGHCHQDDDVPVDPLEYGNNVPFDLADDVGDANDFGFDFAQLDPEDLAQDLMHLKEENEVEEIDEKIEVEEIGVEEDMVEEDMVEEEEVEEGGVEEDEIQEDEDEEVEEESLEAHDAPETAQRVRAMPQRPQGGLPRPALGHPAASRCDLEPDCQSPIPTPPAAPARVRNKPTTERKPRKKLTQKRLFAGTEE